MKKEDVKVGEVYAVRIGGAVENSPVRVEGWSEGNARFGRRDRWHGTNLRTGKRITGTAARLRYRMEEIEGRWSPPRRT